MGFYWMAVGADVPLLLACIDYKNRVVSLADLIYPTGDFAADFPRIQEYYRSKIGIEPDYDPTKLAIAQKAYGRLADDSARA